MTILLLLYLIVATVLLAAMLLGNRWTAPALRIPVGGAILMALLWPVIVAFLLFIDLLVGNAGRGR